MHRLAFSLAALVLISIPWPAHGDECTLDAECALPRLFSSRPTDWQWQLHGSFSADGRATSGGDARLASLGAGFDVAYASDDCRWVGLAADLQGYADRDGQGLSGQEALTLCLPIQFNQPELTISHQRDLIPRLSAPPYFRASRFGSLGVGLRVRMMRFPLSSVDVRVGHADVQINQLTQDVDGQPSTTQDFEVGFSLVELSWSGRGFLGGDRSVDILRIHLLGRGTDDPAESADPDDGRTPQASATVLSPARLRGLAIDKYRFDLDLGVVLGQFADVGPLIRNPDGTLEENFAARSSAVTPHADLHVMWGDGRRAQGVRYQHTLAPSSYDSLVVEDRLSGWARFGAGDSASASATTVRGFATITRILDEDGTIDSVVTGGVAASRDMHIGDHVHLGLTGEVARSFYADLHATSRIEAGWAARILAEIGLQADSHN